MISQMFRKTFTVLFRLNLARISIANCRNFITVSDTAL